MFNKRSRMAAIIAVCSVMVFFGAIFAAHAITNIGTITVDVPRGKPEPPAIPVQNACKIEDSVALHTGEFVLSITDLALPGRGPDLVIAHTYKSGSNIRGRWGRGWHLSVDIRVLRLENGNLLLVDGDGRKHEFRKKADGSGYTPPAGVFGQLVETGDGGFARITPSGDRYEFDQEGKPTRMENRNGKGWTFSYADSTEANMSVTGTSDFFMTGDSDLLARTHKLETITDEAGREIRFFYHNDGRLDRLSGPGDREMTYAYDERGRLTHIRLPPLPDAGAGETDAYRFTYKTGTSRLVEATDPAGIVVIENDYDDQGRLQEQTHRGRTLMFAYDRENRATTVTRPNGVVDQYVFNDRGNPTRIIRDKGGEERLNLDADYAYDDAMNMTQQVDPGGMRTDYEYDAAGNLTKITQNQGDSESITSTYEYQNGRIAKIIDPLSRETSFSYADNGHLKKITHPSGEKLAFEYNDSGDLTNIIEIATDGDEHDAQFSYDAHGYISAITDRMNKPATLTHNDLGQVESFTDRDGVVYLYEHDLRGRLLRKSIQPPSDSDSDSDSEIAEFEYEKNGKLRRITTPGDGTISYGYDTNGRIERIDGPNWPDTQYAYDDAGNLQTVTHNDDPVLWFSHDALNRLIRMSYEIQYVGPNPDNQYEYDASGNLTAFEDARGNRTEFDYDAYNQLTQTRYPDGKTETREYDAAGNLVSLVDRAGNAFNYEYDAANRLKKETGGGGDPVMEYQYNSFGLLKSATVKEGDAASVVAAADYEYNALGRPWIVRQGDYTVGYEYTPEGKLATLKYPNPYEIDYAYDVAGRLEAIKDAKGPIASFDYDGAGRLSRKEMGNGLAQTYTWNDAGQMATVKVTRDAVDGAISTTTYAYDAFGNLETASGPLGQFEYGYDALNRLVSAGYLGPLAIGDAECQYDWVGNRTTVVIQGGIATAYSLPEKSNCYSSAGGTSLGCDANGNLEKDSLNHYTYDKKNRLIKVDAGDIEVQYAYDHEGLLIRRRQSDAAGEITYVYDGDRMIAECNAEGDTLRRYVYHPENGDLIRMSVIGQAKYYFLTDPYGSVVAIADEAGNIVERYAYDAFGNFIIRDDDGTIETSRVGNPFYFAGDRFDETTGLYIDSRRHYHPGIGRYLQPDPDGYDIAGNSYTYMNNNPFNENILPPPPSAPAPESATPAETMFRNLFSDPSFVTVDPAIPRPRPTIHYIDPNTSNVWTPPGTGITIPYLIRMPPMGR